MGHVTPESFCLYYRGGSRFQMTLSLQLAVIQQPYAIIKCKYSVRLFTQHDLSWNKMTETGLQQDDLVTRRDWLQAAAKIGRLVLSKFWTIRYDTIRDAILTCARKPTWIGLIYRTETTTKNCKTEKLKSKSRYVRSNSESLGNHVVRSEKRKRKAACSGKDLQKKVLSGMKERVGDEKLIIITNKCNC